MRFLKGFWFIVVATLISACSADIDEYQTQAPRFDLFSYFDGEVHAWGMVQDYRNKQARRFTVVIEGSVRGDTLTLNEDFIYADGETDNRVWTISREGEGYYTGYADDILGEAKGREVGNALQWKYDFELAVDGTNVEVTFDDWLYRQDSKRVFNLTSITKLGVEVGRVTLFFEKQ